LLEEKYKDVAAFVAVSDYFAGVMRNKMNIPEKKLHVVHIGVDPDLYSMSNPSKDSPVIGYLSRMNENNGFGILVDAFIKLKEEKEFKNARLRCTGGKTGDDKSYINKQVNKLRKKNYLNEVEFIDDFRTENLPGFFNGLSVISVPVLKGEAFGRYQIEALASGIPVVQPSLGGFPEIINATDGGLVYEPNTSEALADKLKSLLSDPDKLLELSKNGRQAVLDKFSSKKLTEKMLNIYGQLIDKG